MLSDMERWAQQAADRLVANGELPRNAGYEGTLARHIRRFHGIATGEAVTFTERVGLHRELHRRHDYGLATHTVAQIIEPPPITRSETP